MTDLQTELAKLLYEIDQDWYCNHTTERQPGYPFIAERLVSAFEQVGGAYPFPNRDPDDWFPWWLCDNRAAVADPDLPYEPVYRFVRPESESRRVVVTEHKVDRSRTVAHDLDRAGDYYDTWCVCGVQLTDYVPHWTETGQPGGSVERALAEHCESVEPKESNE